ncbi:MAG: hypothetical protein HC875_26135 [Anaerolineales bacterium]|nr:hypothetical protein [Anaerolineales bacterium]
MKYLEEFSLIALIALFYFASVYFAVAALVLILALPVALVAVIVGMIGYRILDARGNNKPDLLLAVLFLAPTSCIAAGVIWWIVRLLGFWEVK